MIGTQRKNNAARTCWFEPWPKLRLPLLMGLTMLVLSARPALAAEYCVGTVAELDAALNEAASASQTLFTTTILLKQGTYHVGGTRLTLPEGSYYHALELLGGYNSDCSARTLNPDNTIFDADGANLMLLRPLAELVVEGIRFQNLGGFGRVTLYFEADDLTVRVRNNAFVGAGVHFTSANYDNPSMQFVNNRVTGFPSGGFAAVYMGGLSKIRFTFNTIADNLSDNAVQLCGNGSDVWLVDNIAWNNTGHDFRVLDDCGNNDPGEARSRSNLYQSVSLIEVGDSGSNLVGTDPLFVNAADGNYRLQNASPAVNTGVVTSTTPDLDLAGNPRTVGSTPDRGAYESSVDDTIPVTLTVTTTSDSGPGSLRQAILDANVNEDFNFINFNIPGACPRVIGPTSADLPAIVNGVRIDGWTQPGSVSNTRSKGDNATRCIVLAGGGGRSNGLQFNGSSSEQFWVQGMAFAGFSPGGGSGTALRIFGGADNIVRGNQFGGTLSAAAGSLALTPSDTNILLTGFSSSAIGGESSAHRNVIAGANVNGVLVTSSGVLASNNNEILDNLIGSYGLESTAAGNGTGIRIQTSGNTVRGNTIIYSGLDGVLMNVAAAQGNVLQDNRIGERDFICTGLLCFGGPAGNGRHGVFFDFGPHDNIVYNNFIKHNVQHGIFMFSDTGATSLRNWLIGNRLYNNGGAGTRFTVYNGADNDGDPAQLTMANRGLNYPVITSAYGSTTQGVVEGTLNTTNGSYVVDVFSSALPDAGNPRGEAEVFHRSFYSVLINNAARGQNGSASFSIPFPAGNNVNLSGRVITLTVADSAGNTSELSAPVVYTLNDTVFANGFE